jgi:hypothetical protein
MITLGLSARWIKTTSIVSPDWLMAPWARAVVDDGDTAELTFRLGPDGCSRHPSGPTLLWELGPSSAVLACCLTSWWSPLITGDVAEDLARSSAKPARLEPCGSERYRRSQSRSGRLA